jgi:hypothetical protein
MAKLTPTELAELLGKFTNTELFAIDLRHRYAAYEEFPELVDYLQWCAAKKEDNMAEINRLTAIPLKQRGLI